jgi:hypothetical protein
LACHFLKETNQMRRISQHEMPRGGKKDPPCKPYL